jgi:predicted kinase
MKKSIILVRGCPGAGKNAFADLMSEGKYPIYSADDYFMNGDKYEFDVQKLSNAHNDCHYRVHLAVISGIEKIFVTNTFTQDWEMTYYIDLAKVYEYDIYSIIVENRHEGVNVHDVPDKTINKMKERFMIKL